MIELPNDVLIYGFAFMDDITVENMDELHDGLIERGVVMEEVVLSTWDDEISKTIWIIAADRYLNEDEIDNTIKYIAENQLQDEYCLTGYLTYY